MRYIGIQPKVHERSARGVIQGWRITDPGTLAEIGTVPGHETVLRLPKRMTQLFKEVSDDGAAGL
jgi:hypothetical protein